MEICSCCIPAILIGNEKGGCSLTCVRGGIDLPRPGAMRSLGLLGNGFAMCFSSSKHSGVFELPVDGLSLSTMDYEVCCADTLCTR